MKPPKPKPRSSPPPSNPKTLLAAEKLPSESHEGISPLFQFLTRFLYSSTGTVWGGGITKPPKYVLSAKRFIYAIAALGHFGTTWGTGILYRTNTKYYRRIKA
jgi:hypothetical protein